MGGGGGGEGGMGGILREERGGFLRWGREGKKGW